MYNGLAQHCTTLQLSSMLYTSCKTLARGNAQSTSKNNDAQAMLLIQWHDHADGDACPMVMAVVTFATATITSSHASSQESDGHLHGPSLNQALCSHS